MSESTTVTVCLEQCESYQQESLRPLVQKHLELLNIPSDLSGKRVLLKPNLISARAPSLACTASLFVAAIARSFIDRGAVVLLGDSPAFGSAEQVLKKQGYLTALAGVDVRFLEFRRKTKIKLDCGVSVTVASEALDCDYFVNLPKIKAHQQMGLTMAVKNVFGIVVGARKAWLHMAEGGSHPHFARLILDLLHHLPPTIGIADGITVMNRTGPMNGVALSLGCLATSKNLIALDRAMTAVLAVDASQVPLLVEAKNSRMAGASLEQLSFPLLQPDAFPEKQFSMPTELLPVRFQVSQYFRSSLKRLLTK